MAIQKRTTTAGLALATSANGTVRNGASLSAELFALGGIVFECTSVITTSLVVATFVPQGSVDGTTWYDLKWADNPTAGTSPAGTGAPITTTVALCLPAAASVYPLVRCTATLSGAGTVAADKSSVTYRYVQPGGFAQVQ